MSLLIVLIALIVISLIVVFVKTYKDERGKALHMPKIHECFTLNELVMAINHGRVYPYYTGMTIEQVRKIVTYNHENTREFENNFHLCSLMGVSPIIELPKFINEHLIKNVSMYPNKRGLISSITIDIEDFESKQGELLAYMFVKFGQPASINGQFIIWRERFMVINVDNGSGSISVIDERLFNN